MGLKEFLDKWRKKPVLLIILFILIAVIVVAFIMYPSKDFNVIMLAMIGAASFAVPLLLSFDDKYNLGTRLDNGEVRKSIAISLTMVYIIMLSIFFVTYLPYLGPLNDDQIGDDQNNSLNASGKDSVKIGLSIPLLVQPAVAQQSSANRMDENGSEAENESLEEANPQEVDDTPEIGNEQSESMSDNPIDVPIEALASIYKNFLYVYVIIIGFYFGSRVFEDFAGVRMFKELKGFVPEDLLKKRYAMGEISKDDYLKRIVDLEKPSKLDFFIDMDAKQLRITNKSDEEICIKEAYVDGVLVFEKENLIGAKKHSDIEIEIKDLIGKDIYSIESITDSGKVISNNATRIKIK